MKLTKKLKALLQQIGAHIEDESSTLTGILDLISMWPETTVSIVGGFDGWTIEIHGEHPKFAPGRMSITTSRRWLSEAAASSVRAWYDDHRFLLEGT